MAKRKLTREVAPADTAVANILSGYDPTRPESVNDVVASVKANMRIFFLQMNRVQEDFVRIKNANGRTPRNRIFEAGNQSGKTTIGVAEDLAHAWGFRPWLKATDPDYRVRIKVPNVGMLGVEVAGQNLIQRIEPLLRELIPSYCEPQYDRYPDGAIKSVTFLRDANGNANGSTIHFRSYAQLSDTYEGVISDWVHWDEPPPQSILNAANRGRMASNAPSWFTMTPLKEPYIYDVYSQNAFNGDGTNPEIAIFRCATWENCQDWCRDCDVYIDANNPDLLAPGEIRPVDHCPSCGKVMGFMSRAGINNYFDTITDTDERESRESGKWKHLSGMVYKELDRAIHLYDDFPIPPHWMRIECVDPHDARPVRWLFGAVSPEDITIDGKRANRIYWYDHLLPTGNIDTIVRAVKVKRAERDYVEPHCVILDAKFGTKTVRTAEDVTTWEEELVKAGIKRIRLSHSAPGDIAIGHKAVKSYLALHYSVLQSRAFPGMMFAKIGCSGTRSPIQDMWNYRWDEKNDEKPEEAYKDFCDCVRYGALEQPVYHAPQLDGIALPPMPRYNPSTYGLSLR